jgi:RHS repeat-associated protein
MATSTPGGQTAQDNSGTTAPPPPRPPSKSAACPSSHSLALRADGTVWAWGNNTDGQLGNNSTTNAKTPVQASGLSGISAIAAAPGGYHSLALKSDGTLWSWGLNSSGQLGNNSTTNAKTPVQVNGLAGAVAIGAGANHSLAVKSDGTAWAWGANSCGQLGNNSTTNAKVPVQVSGLTGVSAVAGGSCHSLALKSDGTVWTWGSNTYGQLGNGTTTSSLVPIQVTNLTGVIAIAAGANDSLALKSDGTVWAWGYNNYGQLGAGNTSNSSTPIQVKSLTAAAAIGSGGNHSLYANSVGLPFSVGQNTSGQLGNGTTTNASTDVQVSNLAGLHAPTSSTYTYDGDGLRAASTTAGGTQQYTWDEAGDLPVVIADGANSYIYGPNDLPIEQISTTGIVLYYHHDQLGATRLLTNSTGAIAATYTYNGYGQLTSQSGASDTPLRWAGQYQDVATGLYDLRARSYDPATGQFMTRDPIDMLTRQAYSYGGDNPMNQLYLYGLSCGWTSPWDCVGDVGHAASTAVSSVASWVANHPWQSLELAAAGACVVASDLDQWISVGEAADG